MGRVRRDRDRRLRGRALQHHDERRLANLSFRDGLGEGPEVLIIAWAAKKGRRTLALAMVVATVYETFAFLIPDWLFYTYGLFGYGSPTDLYSALVLALPDLATFADLAFIPVAFAIIAGGGPRVQAPRLPKLIEKMLRPEQQGKVPREFLESVVFANLGAKRSSFLVEPGHGLDNAVISLGGKKVLVVTSDPLSVIPSVGLKESAWLSVHLLASDLDDERSRAPSSPCSTSTSRPRWTSPPSALTSPP